MVKNIDPDNIPRGSWNQPVKDESPFVENKGKIITIIALVAIGGIAGGALLIYFKVNALTGWCLIGAGGFLTVADVVIGIYLCRPKTEDPVGNATYTVVSWSVNKSLDAFKEEAPDSTPTPNWRKTVITLFNKFRRTKKEDDASEPDTSYRGKLSQQVYKQFNEADIICLQETAQMSPEDFKMLWPENYSYFTYHNEHGVQCSVVWNSAQFKLINHAEIQYDGEELRSENLIPDTAVLLRDENNNAKVCVCSTYIRSFILKTTKGTEERNKETQKARGGDNQLTYLLNTMELADADIYILAGNLSATTKLYKKRFQLLEESGYISIEKNEIEKNEEEKQPTTLDLILKNEDGTKPLAIKSDHIFAKSREGTRVALEAIELETAPLEEPGEHIPIAATITFTA